MKKSSLVKNISYSMMGNFVSLLTSFFMILIVPKFISIDNYGYWQLYMFYLSYFGVLHFGISDGIYLRYLGKIYDELKFNIFKGQAILLVVIEIIMALMISLYAITIKDGPYQLIIMGLALSLIFFHINLYNTFVLQLTNRISDFATLLMVEQVSFISIVLGILYTGEESFYFFIIAKISSLILSSVYGMWLIRNIWRAGLPNIYDALSETSKNVKIGIQITIATTASMLIIGVIRYAISKQWDIATFGKISLTLSLSNFLIVFTSAISIALLPFLRNSITTQIGEIYKCSRNIVSCFMIGVVSLFFPVNYVINIWLPQYSDALVYMSILFPILYFESRVQLLSNNFMKVMRKETALLAINVSVVILSIVFTFITVFLFKNLTMTVFSIVLCFAIRCLALETYIDRCLHNSITSIFILDITFFIIFIYLGWNYADFVGFIIYISACIILLIMYRKKICKSYKFIKENT